MEPVIRPAAGAFMLGLIDRRYAGARGSVVLTVVRLGDERSQAVGRGYEIRFSNPTVAEPCQGQRKEPEARRDPMHVLRLIQYPLPCFVKRMRKTANAQVPTFWILPPCARLGIVLLTKPGRKASE